MGLQTKKSNQRKRRLKNDSKQYNDCREKISKNSQDTALEQFSTEEVKVSHSSNNSELDEILQSNCNWNFTEIDQSKQDVLE